MRVARQLSCSTALFWTLLRLTWICLSFCTLSSARVIWERRPASLSNLIQTAFPLGNGRLGAMVQGGFPTDIINFNVDTLWSGGPFDNSSYNGGNKLESTSSKLPGIRDWIFQKGTGNVSALAGDASNYGSYQVMANLSVTLDGITQVKKYRRELNLQTAVHTVSYTYNNSDFMIVSFCSYPSQLCVYHINTTSILPEITIKLENQLRQPKIPTTCGLNALTYRGRTNGNSGMSFYSRALLFLPEDEDNRGKNFCQNDTLVIPAETSREVTIFLGGDTNYAELKGKPETKFSYKGSLQTVLMDLSMDTTSDFLMDTIIRLHVDDYQSWFDQFAITINNDNTSLTGSSLRHDEDPGADTVLFDYGRYLLIATSRSNSLPPNLAGRWSTTLNASAGDDYHLNGNLQMCYTSHEVTGLGDLGQSLWSFVSDTLAPRGVDTARNTYNAPGWVAHGQSNIFGHTGMLPNAQSSNFPIAAAWLTNSFWDHYEYTQNVTWYRLVGYPLIRGVAEFWVDQLQEDAYNKDGSLVAAPCNAPEHGPTTFGCTQYQHIIWEIFDKVLKSVSIVEERNQTFVNQISHARLKLDSALRIGDWGQIQEFKMPIENRSYAVNHLSQLYGAYPGYYIAHQLNNNTLNVAVSMTLRTRRDATNGWANTLRAALWATIGQGAPAYVYVRRALSVYFTPNLLSTTNGQTRIDANCGYVNAIMAMLVFDKPQPYSTRKRPKEVILGPAIPLTWGAGHVRGVRLRGSGIVDFWWDEEGLVTQARLYGRVGEPVTLVNIRGTTL